MGLIKKQAGFDLKSKIETWIKESITSQTFMYGALTVDEKTMMIEFTDIRDISTAICLIIIDNDEGKLPPPYICFDTPAEIHMGYMPRDTQIKLLDTLNKITQAFPNLGLINARYDGGLQPFIRVNDKFVMVGSIYSYGMGMD